MSDMRGCILPKQIYNFLGSVVRRRIREAQRRRGGESVVVAL
jgi:hypothetical protein